MGYTAGELANSFHFLRVAQVFVMLELFFHSLIYFNINSLQCILNKVFTFSQACCAVTGNVLLTSASQRVFRQAE